MGEGEPTLQDVLEAVAELRTEMRGELGDVRSELGEVRVGLGDVRGRVDRLGVEVGELHGEVTEQGHRLDALTGEVETLGRETRKELRELSEQVVAGVLVGFERSAYATDLRTLQAEVAELKADVAELKRASGE